MVLAISVVVTSIAGEPNYTEGQTIIPEFNEIRVEAEARLKIIESDDFSIRIICNDTEVLSGINYSVIDKKLVIKADESIKNKEILIIVTNPDYANTKLTTSLNYTITEKKK